MSSNGDERNVSANRRQVVDAVTRGRASDLLPGHFRTCVKSFDVVDHLPTARRSTFIDDTQETSTAVGGRQYNSNDSDTPGEGTSTCLVRQAAQIKQPTLRNTGELHSNCCDQLPAYINAVDQATCVLADTPLWKC